MWLPKLISYPYKKEYHDPSTDQKRSINFSRNI